MTHTPRHELWIPANTLPYTRHFPQIISTDESISAAHEYLMGLREEEPVKTNNGIIMALCVIMLTVGFIAGYLAH